ncbi:hypothetical protein [Flavobacterium sp.]|jgi:hypothetical protein|uniref:hypothetical protein n=1 Tax=Flavobacterium sp. TaxID=239 RepID=UPI0037BF16A5
MANDWNSVRAMALDCLNSTWDMVCWAARSQEDDYDREKAARHLAAIDTALNTFRQAMEIFQPGLECATSDLKHSPVFDALALASVGEGPRPDFGLCATAHEKAFKLLRMAILWVEDGLNDELDRRGAPDNHVVGISDMHKRSPEQLRDTLCGLEQIKSLQSVLPAKQLPKLRAWIDREWAAVVGRQTRLPNSEFVPLTLMSTSIPRDASTIKRWKDQLRNSEKELRGNRWFVDYAAFRLIAVAHGIQLPLDKNELQKRVAR